jgi:hypothetical protein
LEEVAEIEKRLQKKETSKQGYLTKKRNAKPIVKDSICCS